MDRIEIKSLVNSETLGGATQGGLLFVRLLEAFQHSNERIILLDFGGIAIATASYLRASALAFRKHLQQSSPPIALIFCNLAPEVQEELQLLLLQQNDSVVTAVYRDASLSFPTVLGSLDEMQSETLKMILNVDDAVDARRLAEIAGEDVDTRRFTKWNNRLSLLTLKGLLIEQNRGRAKVYCPVVKGLRYGD